MIIPYTVTLPTWLLVGLLLYPLYIALFGRLWDKFWNVYRVKPDGFVYLMRRADGIYKIGQTSNLQDRAEQLSRQYHQPVNLVTYWAVPNVATYERRALDLTRPFAVDQTELRAMTTRQAREFIFSFTVICEKMGSARKVEVIG